MLLPPLLLPPLPGRMSAMVALVCFGLGVQILILPLARLRLLAMAIHRQMPATWIYLPAKPELTSTWINAPAKIQLEDLSARS